VEKISNWLGKTLTCWLCPPCKLRIHSTIPPVQAKQLRDYENAVIAKRLEELDEDELIAMMEDIDREKNDEAF
jgi:hypothetical protein